VAACLLLVIFLSLVPVGDTLVRIVAAIGLLYFGYGAFFGSKYWLAREAAGKSRKWRSRNLPFPNAAPYRRAMTIGRCCKCLPTTDWAGLADEPAATDRPLQRYIHEYKAGKIFYLQLSRYFSSSDFRGVTEVKEVGQPQYSEFYRVIKT
jgi:hypothetical protein